MCRGADSYDVGGGCGGAGCELGTGVSLRRKVGRKGRGIYPDYNTFPIMTMSKSGRGLVFWHIPGVHDGVVVTVGCGASVDLAGAGGAVAVCSSSRG
jgi:hypothetical protein